MCFLNLAVCDRAITGLSVSCVPSLTLQSRLVKDFGYSIQTNEFVLCQPVFFTRCDPGATVEERCPPARRSALSNNPPSSTSESPKIWEVIVGVVSSLVAMATGKLGSEARGTGAQLRVHTPSSWKWNPTCVNGVPTNTAKCCIWSQAFPGTVFKDSFLRLAALVSRMLHTEPILCVRRCAPGARGVMCADSWLGAGFLWAGSRNNRGRCLRRRGIPAVSTLPCAAALLPSLWQCNLF
jgi:hypothetical protein